MVTASTEFLLYSYRSPSTSTCRGSSVSPVPSLYVLPETPMDDTADLIPEPPLRFSRSYVGYINDEDANDWVAAKVCISTIAQPVQPVSLTIHSRK